MSLLPIFQSGRLEDRMASAGWNLSRAVEVYSDQAIETGLAVVTDGALLFDEPEPIGLQKTDQFTERHRIAASRWSICWAER